MGMTMGKFVFCRALRHNRTAASQPGSGKGKMRFTTVAAAFAVGFATLHSGQLARAQGAPYKNLSSYVKYVQSTHRAPFHRDGVMLPKGGAKELLRKWHEAQPLAEAPSGTNVKVNQDRDPWPKAEIGSAVDPTDGQNYLVMSNDFRENYDHMFFHVSTTGGATWTDDSMVGGNDPNTGFIPLTFQSDPGLAFDTSGHSFLSTITGNLIFDGVNGYQNNDTQIEVAQGYAHGEYANLLPIVIDTQPCIFTFTSSNCNSTLDKPLITVDDVAGSPNNGTVYVYYTLFCGPNPCTDGSATVPAFGSAILESHTSGGFFTSPALVSGALTNTQFSYLVVDSKGTPHMFFDDFTNPYVNMWESTLTAGTWVVSASPVASFYFTQFSNPNWGFRDFGAAAPGCGIRKNTAYCAFSANQIVGKPGESTPSVYLAVVNTLTGASTVHRVNNDAWNNGKNHFFGWATATSAGVYVGWYDDRNDPFNTTVQYFVGKSTDGGKTFPTQTAVSDTAFNPCIGFPGCGFFGDYTQLVSGPDGVVHAAWSDTRDAVSMQIYSQAVTW